MSDALKILTLPPVWNYFHSLPRQSVILYISLRPSKYSRLPSLRLSLLAAKPSLSLSLTLFSLFSFGLPRVCRG